MLRFGKFIRKIETEVVVARDSFQAEVRAKFSSDFVEKSAVLFVSSEFAKTNGLEEGQIVNVAVGEKAVKLKVAISEAATKATIPNSIYANHLANFDSFKRFKASIEIVDGKQTHPSEILDLIKLGL
jgi:formylmethanofuran dehydrogenase subunit D